MATTTPNYGWTVPTSTDLVKDGATAIETLGDAIDASMNTALGTKKAGMVLLNTTSFSAVASQSVNNVFNATYDNYLINFKATASSATTSLSLRLRNAGTDLTGAIYDRAGTIAYNNSATINALNQTGVTAIGFPDISSVYPEYTSFSLTLFNPFLSKAKTGHLQGAGVNGSSQVAGMQFNLAVANNTSHDGFTLITGSGNFSGTIRVYGINI
jgi:hypothetical protein